MGQHIRHVDGQATTLLGDHTYIMGTQQRQALGAQLCGQLHAFWATMTLPVGLHVIALASHNIVWTTTKCYGHPMNCRLGHPHKIMGTHITKHGQPSCDNGRPRIFCGLPRFASWSAIRDIMGDHHVVVDAHVKRVESHVYSWVPTRKCGLPRI